MRWKRRGMREPEPEAVEPERRVRTRAVELHASGHADEAVFRWIKLQGGNQIDCIVFLRASREMSMADAKRVVDASPVWAREMIATHELRALAIEMLESEPGALEDRDA